MKRIVFFIAFVMLAFSASAQKNTSVSEPGLSYSKKTFYLDGNAIPSDQLASVIGEGPYQTYRKSRGLKTAGIVCTSVGGAALVGGLIGVISAFNSNSTGDILVGGLIGTPCAIAGGLIAIPGIVMWCVGSHRIKAIPIEYNSKSHRTAYLAPAPSGMGLALNF